MSNLDPIACPQCGASSEDGDIFTQNEYRGFVDYTVNGAAGPNIEEDTDSGEKTAAEMFFLERIEAGVVIDPEAQWGLQTNYLGEGHGEQVLRCRHCEGAFAFPSLRIVERGEFADVGLSSRGQKAHDRVVQVHDDLHNESVEVPPSTP